MPPATGNLAPGTPGTPRMPGTDDASAPTLDDKLRFLRSQAAHAGSQHPPTALETHMSWLFFAGDRVLKLKKPVRFDYLDFSTLAAREFYCREEVRLNTRLAPGIYLGLVALQASTAGLALVPEAQLPAAGETVDWLVVMLRLPQERMLADLLAHRQVRRHDIDAVVAVLGAFYRHAPKAVLSGPQYLARFEHELAINREVLLRPQFQLPDAAPALDRLDAALFERAALLRQRASAGCVVDGHGDLRPEHVCMLEPPVVIDCLEFNAPLRQVDPWDEIAYLSLECDMAGATWVGPQLESGCARAMGDAPAPALMLFYTAYRASLRARLAIAHLLDAQPRTPQKWAPLAQRYIERVLRATTALGPIPAD